MVMQKSVDPDVKSNFSIKSINAWGGGGAGPSNSNQKCDDQSTTWWVQCARHLNKMPTFLEGGSLSGKMWTTKRMSLHFYPFHTNFLKIGNFPCCFFLIPSILTCRIFGNTHMDLKCFFNNTQRFDVPLTTVWFVLCFEVIVLSRKPPASLI